MPRSSFPWTAVVTIALSRAVPASFVGWLRYPVPGWQRYATRGPAPASVWLHAQKQQPQSPPPSPPTPQAPPEACDVDGLRKEAQRKLYRAQKKASKAEDRAAACEAKQEALLEDENASLEDLEALPPCEELRAAAQEAVAWREELEGLVAGLQAAAKGSDPAEDAAAGGATLAELVQLAKRLGVDDKPPPRPPPPPKKKKGPRASTAPRLPYRVYRSKGGAEIRVGKQAQDNDVLSTDPAHRDNDDWWLHAAGCPGSHVVVRRETVAGDALPREVELDAAVLAANYSKAARSGTVGVNVCRARQVSKPYGAKPGLVQLSGDVKTVKLNWRKEKGRLDRLGSEGLGEAAS